MSAHGYRHTIYQECHGPRTDTGDGSVVCRFILHNGDEIRIAAQRDAIQFWPFANQI